MPTTFMLTDYDVGNTNLTQEEEGSLSFTLQTQRNFMDKNKQTTITTSGTEDNTLSASIDWKDKTIEIQGVRKPSAVVKQRIGGAFSS